MSYDLIVFRDAPARRVEWPQHVVTDPGWVRVVEYYHDPSFGDMGISGDRDVIMFPSERVYHVERKQVESDS